MILIGLTGGLATGKSSVSRLLAERGAVIIDADKIAKDVLENDPDAIEAVRKRFGEIDRQALGEKVFADLGARRDLEAIMHPIIYSRIRDEIEAHKDGLVVVDAALLVETGGASMLALDAIVVVHAQPSQQIARAAQSLGLTREQAAKRIASQSLPSDRLAAADYVVNNTGTQEELAQSVDTLMAELRQSTAAR